jgi:CRISPR-associated protein Cmr3
MNTLLLQPSDVLFFRDGRPMSGSLTGHGASWPLPTVLNAALHAALWRSEIESHKHVPGRSSSLRDYSDENRGTHGRKYGSLFSAGPFPEFQGIWYFPRPADAQRAGDTEVTLCPRPAPCASSLPQPLIYMLASNQPPTKDKAEAWWSREAWQSYLSGAKIYGSSRHFINDAEFYDSEHSIGIGIDPQSGTQNNTQFYTANYLRLKPDWRLGCLAQAKDKKHEGEDIIPKLFKDNRSIIVGGQQRVCTAVLQQNQPLRLPTGAQISGTRVKWVLLTPAIFPKIGEHPGGSLPCWINHRTGQVELLDGPGKNAAKRRKVEEGKPIRAKLVAALVGKSLPVTGYALPHEVARSNGGAKPTHLAVPAGSVYYFECEDEASAQKLAAVLNWHGADAGQAAIRHRRSTLFGEKGFGLGVCGTWNFHNDKSAS